MVMGAAAPIGVAAAPAASPILTSQPPRPIEDFELTDQDGAPFRFSQLRGRPALIFFGYTHCPDVCPLTLGKLQRVLDTADPSLHEIGLVMISVDGNRDDAPAMKAYLSALAPHGIGLTGDPRAVRQVAAQFSSVFIKQFPDKAGGPYLVEHTSQVYLVDRQGRLRETFFDAPIDSMAHATAAVAREPAGP